MRRRIVLIVLAATLGMANVWWWSHRAAPEEVSFHLTLSGHELQFGKDNNQNIPLFDAKQRKWILGDKQIPSLREFLEPYQGGDVGPPVGEYVVIKLPFEANANVFRQALLVLVDDGICQFAIFGEGDLPDYATLYRIKDVRSDSGAMVPCRQKLPS